MAGTMSRVCLFMGCSIRATGRQEVAASELDHRPMRPRAAWPFTFRGWASALVHPGHPGVHYRLSSDGLSSFHLPVTWHRLSVLLPLRSTVWLVTRS